MNGDFRIRRVVDLSVTIKSQDTPVFPGYPQPLRTNMTTLRDNGYLSYFWSFVEHTATHVDAPAHFVEGAPTVDAVPLSTYVGQGLVLDFSNKPPRYSIRKEDIEEALKSSGLERSVGPGWVLLFYTGYTAKSRDKDWMDHPELSEEACKYIVTLRVNAIGFDAPSPDHDPFPAHKILLPKGMGNYENLNNLGELLGKRFLFVGAPLALFGGSASPVRAIAILSE